MKRFVVLLAVPLLAGCPRKHTSPADAGPPPPPPPPAVEVEDSSPGSPRASMTAAPAWANHTHAELHEAAATVWGAGKPLSGALENAFVVCKLESDGHADGWGDDLLVDTKLGKTDLPEVAGPDNTNLAFVSYRWVTFAPGDTARFDVYDRDETTTETIAKVSIVYSGQSLRIEEKRVTIDCRELSGPVLDKQIARLETAADAANAALARQRLAPRHVDWDWPTKSERFAQTAIEDLATLTGWDEARVVKRADGYTAALRKLEDKRAQIFGTLHANAKDTAAFEGFDVFDVKLGAVTCEKETCKVQVTFGERKDGASLHFGGTGHDYVYFARERGWPAILKKETNVTSSLPEDIVFDFEGPDLADGPALLAICVHPEYGADICRFLKVR